MIAMVIGSGGREHAIAWALAKSPLVTRVVCNPGNAGTENEDKCINIAGDALKVAKEECASLIVVGPEVPLCEGFADKARAEGILCVGPGEKAAKLEGSKDFAKKFMKKYGVKCAKSSTFTDSEKAKEYIKKSGAPIVIKADGLAAGKGVIVANTLDEATEAVDALSKLGKKLVIEECLSGAEVSVLSAVCVTEKGAVIKAFLPAQDHKRLLCGNLGPNTGGMGAVCPVGKWTRAINEAFTKDCLEPTLRGIKAEFGEYRGFLFFGVMVTKTGPKVLEYNVRLGDPETQAVLPVMKSDFAQLCLDIAKGELDERFKLEWEEGFRAAPVVVSGGYPGEYKKGVPITIDDAKDSTESAKIFIAGAKSDGGALITCGGRVLSCSAHGATLDEALRRAFECVARVHFEGASYREDIGHAFD